MFNQDKQFRRPDGTLYDPSPFNVRQFEEQYGPGGVPEGYSMGAITPLQDPTTIRVAACFLALLGSGMLTMGFYCFTLPGELWTGIWSSILGLATFGMVWWAFVMAGRRQRWLQAQKATAGQIGRQQR
jgi:hypothetical protein